MRDFKNFSVLKNRHLKEEIFSEFGKEKKVVERNLEIYFSLSKV